MRFGVFALVFVAACVSSDDDEPVDPRCGDGIEDTGEQCDDGNDVTGDGCSACVVDVVTRMVDVTWQFKSLATNSATMCPTGYDAEVSTQQVDVAGVPLAAERIDPFACSLGAGGIPFEVDVLGGLVDTRVRFIDGTGDLYAESLKERVDITDMDQAVAFTLFDDAGYIELEWKLNGQTSGTEINCSTADDIDSIEVTTTNAMHSYVDRFSCEDRTGITGGIIEGVYTVTVKAKRQDVDVATNTMMFQAIGDRNRITPLGVIDLVIPGF